VSDAGGRDVGALPAARRTIPAMLECQAEALGERPLVRLGSVERTCAATREAVARCAGALLAAGVRPGERVAAMCASRAELLDVMLACGWIGAVAVPVNGAIRGPQLGHVLRDSGARFLLVDAELAPALAVVELPPTLEGVWIVGDVPDGAAGRPWSEVAAGGEPVEPADVGAGETAMILYTSGTTGQAKGVCCPHAQFYWWGVNTADGLDIGERDRIYTCLPLFHVNALASFLQALVSGAHCTIEARFSASRYWDRLVEHEATVTSLLGAMVSMLLAQPPGEADRAHATTRALAPGTPATLWEEFGQRFGVQLVEAYGSTETNFAIGAQPHRQRPGWMGRPREGFEARVVDGDDGEVADGTPGELVLRAAQPHAFASGYFGNPEATVEAWRNLWFHTGDQVVRDADGWYRFCDRMKDAIRRRGENISSFEVEQALLDHPAVEVAAVFAVPSPLGEDEVMAAVIVAAGAELDELELIRFCEPRLARFAIPRYVELVDVLPLTDNGKVRKAALRERGVTAATWDREAAGYELRRAPA
jgi:crotonobetaine/carnitine-CoA ligase